MFITVLFGICSDGRKLPPLIIGKSKYPLKNRFPSKMVVRHNSRGWMNTDLMHFWIDHIFNFKISDDTLKILILDRVKFHTI